MDRATVTEMAMVTGMATVSIESFGESLAVETRREKLRRRGLEKEALRSLTLTMDDVEDVLRATKGNIAESAKVLATPRSVLARYIGLNPHLKAVMSEIRQEIIDLAEAKLIEQVEDGYFPAISLVLRTLGKERGYTEKSTLEHELGENTVRNSAALIEAMRKGTTTIDVEDYEWEDKPEQKSLPKTEPTS
jgi:hypothetical protein